MSKEYLSSLGKMIADEFNQDFHLGENTQRTVDLGDFAKKIDQSAERSYYEEGSNRLNLTPKQSKILMQEPEVTVLVKKRAFSSL